MTGIRAARVAKLIELHEAPGNYHDAIKFIRVASTVHVLGPPGERPQRHVELFGDDEAENFMRFALGECWSVCGVRFVRHARGFESGAQMVSHFPDELLCSRCHKEFGIEYGHLIFEANQPDDSDPTQLGSLFDDTIAKGKRLR